MVGIISEVISIERQVIEEEPVIEEEEAPEYVDLTYIYVGVVAIVVLASIALYYLKSRRVRMRYPQSILPRHHSYPTQILSSFHRIA